MDRSTVVSTAALRFLIHHLYEYRKGVRQLFMMTMTPPEAQQVQTRLERESIDFHAHRVSGAKVNIFFGRSPYVAIVRRMVTKPLSQLSPEEDFILGTLLGYDGEQQCLRFLAMTKVGRPVAIRPAVA